MVVTLSAARHKCIKPGKCGDTFGDSNKKNQIPERYTQSSSHIHTLCDFVSVCATDTRDACACRFGARHLFYLHSIAPPCSGVRRRARRVPFTFACAFPEAAHNNISLGARAVVCLNFRTGEHTNTHTQLAFHFVLARIRTKNQGTARALAPRSRTSHFARANPSRVNEPSPARPASLPRAGFTI